MGSGEERRVCGGCCGEGGVMEPMEKLVREMAAVSGSDPVYRIRELLVAAREIVADLDVSRGGNSAAINEPANTGKVGGRNGAE